MVGVRHGPLCVLTEQAARGMASSQGSVSKSQAQGDSQALASSTI